mgnify:CR=1 FL=1
MEEKQLKIVSKKIRKSIFEMITNKGRGHYGGSLSCVELIVALYYQIMKENDKFILSKAHAGPTLYSVLAEKKYIKEELLSTYGQEDSILGVHPEHGFTSEIEFSCGSLGHGLSYSVGLALAAKKKKMENTIYTLIGDGESQEGAIWEAALFATQHKLNNLVVITDYNKKQATGKINNVLGIEPIIDKWKAFGWETQEIDGHSYNQINNFKNNFKNNQKPKMIIAHTIKGKGVSYLEAKKDCHSELEN